MKRIMSGAMETWNNASRVCKWPGGRRRLKLADRRRRDVATVVVSSLPRPRSCSKSPEQAGSPRNHRRWRRREGGRRVQTPCTALVCAGRTRTHLLFFRVRGLRRRRGPTRRARPPDLTRYARRGLWCCGLVPAGFQNVKRRARWCMHAYAAAAHTIVAQ